MPPPDGPRRRDSVFAGPRRTRSEARLSEWVLADRLPVRVQLQLHKYHLDAANARRLKSMVIGRLVRAVVLLSGGLDSYTAAAIAKADGFALNALTIHYGQRHAREVQSARQVALALGVEQHKELTVDLRPIGGSSLTSRHRRCRTTAI